VVQNSITKYTCDDFEDDFISTSDFSLDITTHTHIGWEFLLVKSGKLSYTVDGNVFDISANNLIISRPGEVHALHSNGSINYERYDLILLESLLSKTFMEQIPQDLYVIDVSNNQIIISLYEKIGYYLTHLQGEELETLLRNLINELWINIYLATQQASESVVTHSNTVITKTVNYIKDHIEEPLTVQKLCEDLFISHSYLHHCFSTHMNISPKQYITLQKLQMVQQALSNNMNPTEACRKYGFRTYSTFFRNYQRIYGCRPSDKPPKSRKIQL
jgi:AraC-like DNA-binding protein